MGLLLVAAGIGWLTLSSPAVGATLTRYVEIPGGVAEIALMLWLLVAGFPLHRS